MGNSEVSETKAFFRLILGTLTVLGVLTTINILMIMNSVGTDIFKPLQRNIAAVATLSEVSPEKIESPVIEINCHKKLQNLALRTKASSARILFKNCGKIGRLINKSNQNQGDIFPLKKNQWTSDFIFLNPGENRIDAPLGDDLQTIKITREVAEKKTPNKAL